MNLASRWFVVLAVIALSATRAAAGDQGQDSGKDSSAQSAAADSKDAGTPSKSDSDSKGTLAKDKGSADGDGHHALKSDKGQKPGVTGKVTAVPTIDTTITVNQGKNTTKKVVKNPVLKDATKTKDKDLGSKDATATGSKDKTAKDHRDTKSTDKSDRNAIGVKTDKDKKPVDQRNANGLPTPPTTTASADPKANPTLPAGSAGGVASAGNAPHTLDKGQANGSTVPAGLTNTSVTSGSPVISGTGMVKPVVRTGMITGTPKPGAAVISGNNVSAKHP